MHATCNRYTAASSQAAEEAVIMAAVRQKQKQKAGGDRRRSVGPDMATVGGLYNLNPVVTHIA
jgi:hypothetical protein